MGVVVVGMHRSGTSALAAALERLGLSAGRPDGLLPADRGNPAGYFEQETVAAFHDEVLFGLEGAWDCPPQLANGWITDPAVTPWVNRATGLVDTVFGGQGFVLKDPRIAVLLPLWRRALLDRFSVVMIVRNPVEVAWSLLLRDGIPLFSALALWSTYNRAAVAGLDGLAVHVCSYDQLLYAPRQTLEAVVESLTSWGELPDRLDLDVALDRIQPKLHRETWPRSQRELIELPEEVTALEKLIRGRAGRHDRFEAEVLPVGWWEQPLLDERRRVVRICRELGRLNPELVSSREQVADLEGRLVDREQTLQEVTADAARTQTELALYKARWERLEQRLPVRVYRALRRRRFVMFGAPRTRAA